MNYSEMVKALADYHNAKIVEISDQVYADGAEVWRWIRFESQIDSAVEKLYYSLPFVFDGACGQGTFESISEKLLEKYVSPVGYMFFHDCSGEHRPMIQASSVTELHMKMTVMGIL